MLSGENFGDAQKNYKTYEIQFHRDLMNSCRKYINHLSIVSILGILEIVKQESIDLERATQKLPDQFDETEENNTEN